MLIITISIMTADIIVATEDELANMDNLVAEAKEDLVEEKTTYVYIYIYMYACIYIHMYIYIHM